EKIAVSDGSIAMIPQAGIEEIEVGGELVRRPIGGGFLVERCPQAPPDEGELAAVWFLTRARIQGRRVLLELGLVPLDGGGQLRADRRQPGGRTERTSSVCQRTSTWVAIRCRTRSRSLSESGARNRASSWPMRS